MLFFYDSSVSLILVYSEAIPSGQGANGRLSCHFLVKERKIATAWA